MFDVKITIPMRSKALAETLADRAPEWSHVAASGFLEMGWREISEQAAETLRARLEAAGIPRVEVTRTKVVV